MAESALTQGRLFSGWSSQTESWKYVQADARDLRIDFLRGIIMMIVITVHMEYFSAYSFLVWERVGVISSAEGFVFLSGLVLGMVYGRKADKEGFNFVANKMFDRALQLYRVAIGVIALIAILNTLPFIDAKAVMTWVNPSNGEVFPLYPSEKASFRYWVSTILMLKATPHQFQVMGLYVVMIALAPLFMWCLKHNRVGFLLALSWIVYIIAQGRPERLTGAQFEYAFPIMNWQLIFVHGMALGVFKDQVFAFFSGGRGRVLFWVAMSFAFAGWFFTMNNPNPGLPDWAKLSMIDKGDFWSLYGQYFKKSQLGIGRVLNNVALFIVAMGLLTRFWVPISRALGWFAIPIGQSSLYVFVVHVFFVLAASLTPWHELNNFWINTAMHTVAMLSIWFMVKNKVLFNVIPR